jgi:hypothetical protein
MRRWAVLVFSFVVAGCGTKVLDPGVLPPGTPDATATEPAGMSAPPGQPNAGPTSKPSPPVLGPGTEKPGTTTAPPPANDPGATLPPCPDGQNPYDGKCARCKTISTSQGMKMDTCLACKDDPASPSGACRSCVWTDLPVTVACERCPGSSGPDACDKALDEARDTF